MLNILLVLCAAVKSTVQRSPVASGCLIRAFKLSSIPRLRMLPMFRQVALASVNPAGTGAKNTRSLVFLSYQSIAPLTRWFMIPKSTPRSTDSVDSHLMYGLYALGRIVGTNE